MFGKKLFCGALTALASVPLVGCAAAGNEPPTGVMQETSEQSQRLTQFELDVMFREQAREDVKVLDPENELSVCCVLFYNDVDMLAKIFSHFEKNVDASLSDYGIVVEENEKHYKVQLWPRYKESSQHFVNGRWQPDLISGGYGYIVDRKTLEILNFVEAP